MKQKSKIVEMLMQYKLGYAIVFILIMIDCIATYLYPNYLSSIIDTAIPEKNLEMLIKNIIFLAFLQILCIFVSVMLTYMFTRISNSVVIRIKECIIRTVFKTDGEELSAKARTFTTSMNGDIDNIELLSSRVMAQLILQIATVVITGVILIKINRIVMYFVLAAYPILIATQILFNKKIEKRASILMTRCDIGYSLIKEFVAYIYEYIVLNADNYFLSRFMKNERNIRKGQLKYNMLLAFNGLVPQIINMVIYLTILTISGNMVMTGSILPGEFTIILLYTQRMFSPIANIMAVLGQIQGARVSLKRIDNMLIGCEKI